MCYLLLALSSARRRLSGVLPTSLKPSCRLTRARSGTRCEPWATSSLLRSASGLALTGSRPAPLPFLHCPQHTRQWIDKPDGAIVTAESARATQNRIAGVLRRAQGDVDYYELLQVWRGRAAVLCEGGMPTCSWNLGACPSAPVVTAAAAGRGGAAAESLACERSPGRLSHQFCCSRAPLRTQVPPDATPEQIKKQYYLLAKKWHPGMHVLAVLVGATYRLGPVDCRC